MTVLNPGITKGGSVSDTELKALASTVSSSDTIPYYTGLGVANTTPFTPMARNLLDDVDAATMRATLDAEQHKANLTAIGALASATDTIPYFTGSGTASTTSLTVMARNLLDDPDASTMRTTLGVAIGTNVQAQNVNLQAIAGVTSATDKLPYFTGSGTASVTDLTSQARTFLSQTTAAGQRNVLNIDNTAGRIYSFSVFGGA